MDLQGVFDEFWGSCRGLWGGLHGFTEDLQRSMGSTVICGGFQRSLGVYKVCSDLLGLQEVYLGLWGGVFRWSAEANVVYWGLQVVFRGV